MNRNLGRVQLPQARTLQGSAKKGTSSSNFSLMVAGESGLGKSTLIESLYLSDLYPGRMIPKKLMKTEEIETKTVDIMERGSRVSLRVLDTPGFGDEINSTDDVRAISDFIDQELRRYLDDAESSSQGSTTYDSRVHCCLYFISPYGHGLKPMDLEFMKELSTKVNVIPVIAKADCLSIKEVKNMKARIAEEIKSEDIKIYQIPEVGLRDSVPFTVCGADTMVEVEGKTIRGRQYSWGMVEVDNPDHCDFSKLKTLLVDHMQDLMDVTNNVHYEKFRRTCKTVSSLVKNFNNNY